ncbi:MAG TPA: 2Fe-2S iron-sulfur cluster-binding protein [Polyangiaceae bacterium]|nr:2Fe-2S iron-sulfur cluster-binding protein [Polyangiaceae bacterium]
MWTRADDMRHGRIRPASHHKIRATYALGSVLTYARRAATVQTDVRHGPGEALTAAGADALGAGVSQAFFALTQAAPYHFGVATRQLVEVPLEVPTGSWRSVYSAMVRAADEIMVDEIAKMPIYTFILNGAPVSVEAPADMPLLWVLRDKLGVTGPKYGCGVGVCRACTSHLDGGGGQPTGRPSNQAGLTPEMGQKCQA